MGRILVIGAGGVSTVAVKKIAMNADIFTDIMVASRTKSKCDRIAADIKNVKVQTHRLMQTTWKNSLPCSIPSNQT